MGSFFNCHPTEICALPPPLLCRKGGGKRGGGMRGRLFKNGQCGGHRANRVLGIEGTPRRWCMGGGMTRKIIIINNLFAKIILHNIFRIREKYRSEKFIDIPLRWADVDRHCVSKQLCCLPAQTHTYPQTRHHRVSCSAVKEIRQWGKEGSSRGIMVVWLLQLHQAAIHTTKS
jgi:hypothetical protein